MGDQEQHRAEVLGEVVEHLDGLRFRVRLEDGREVDAFVPKRAAREMFRIVAGDKVRLADPQSPRPRILGFARRR